MQYGAPACQHQASQAKTRYRANPKYGIEFRFFNADNLDALLNLNPCQMRNVCI